MKISLRSFLIAAATSLALGTASTYASDESILLKTGPSEESRIVDGEFSVSDPSATPTLAQDNVGSGLMTEYDDSSDYLPTSVGSDFYTATDRGAGFIGGGEIVFMRPYGSFGQPDLGFKPAYRAWVGYQNENGLGGRIRYWSYDQSRTFDGLETFSLEFHTLDAEFTQQVDYYSWNFLVSGGVRQAESRAVFENLSPGQLGELIGFSGTGLTLSATATRDLNSSGSFRFLAGARWSTLFGNSRYGLDPALTTSINNTTLNILEINAGPQFVRELDNGALLTIFGGVEAQSWNSAYGIGVEDVSLLGFGTSISILR